MTALRLIVSHSVGEVADSMADMGMQVDMLHHVRLSLDEDVPLRIRRAAWGE
jgi:hypothetical protein